MSDFDITTLRTSKQVVPTAKLLNLAEKYGFEIKSSGHGTSHVRCTHTKYPDIVVGLVHNTKKLSSQRDLLEAFQEIAARDEASLAKEFESVAFNVAEALDQKIPADLEYRLTDSGNIVLTDRAYPQIGMTFPQKDAHLAENKVRELTAIKRDYAILLSRMVNEYDMAPPVMKDGVFDGHLTHNVYGHMPEETLPSYQENDIGYDAIKHLWAYQEKISDIDLEHACRKEEALKHPIIQQTLVTSASRRGERHNHVYYNDTHGKTLKFSFNTFSNQRATYHGTTARISLPELEKLEKIVSGISASAERHLKAA